jgi:ribulose-bisphosphate carboxylase large chain
MISGERFSVVYDLVGDRQEAAEKAKDICLEQTVEFPEELLPPGMIADYVVGRIESFESLGSKKYQTVISYAVETTANELTQLLNVIFGNISIKPGVLVSEIKLPLSLLKSFKGPRFGRNGLRQLLKIPHRPLLHTALKPLGLSSKQLAELAFKCALGGIDIIKDDHGLTNQVFAPYEERVSLCADAVQRANQETGGSSIFVANITGPASQIMKRAMFAKAAGAGGLLLAPALTGFDIVRELAENDAIGLPLILHPAFQGPYVINPLQGINHATLFGQISRLAGGDVTIYPNFGGRFSFSRVECESIVKGTICPMGPLRSAFPSPGGGMTMERVPEMLQVYGADVIFLIGGGLFKYGPNLVENCQHFRDIVEQAGNY